MDLSMITRPHPRLPPSHHQLAHRQPPPRAPRAPTPTDESDFVPCSPPHAVRKNAQKERDFVPATPPEGQDGTFGPANGRKKLLLSPNTVIADNTQTSAISTNVLTITQSPLTSANTTPTTPITPLTPPAAVAPAGPSDDDLKDKRVEKREKKKDAGPEVYHLSDEDLGQRFHFEQEIGYGNWGSVWTCYPLSSSSTSSSGRGSLPYQTHPHRRHPSSTQVYAAKLVVRSPESRTAPVRVHALWKEFRLLRSLNQRQAAVGRQAHPAIVQPLSFLLTPSFALLLLPYLPGQMPVLVAEVKARRWFERLLDGVGWLHANGVVHNDIKPANILLTADSEPVLIDFGFSQEHEEKFNSDGTPKEGRFLSQLAYGTPEYLSPERARGHPHDTRKSDIWSLGITFFEILVGRTPFESHPAPPPSEEESASSIDPYAVGKEPKAKGDPDMTTPEGLEVYWQRTVKGKWVGEWDISRGAEKLLRKMLHPNADLRPLVPAALADTYFTLPFPQTRPSNAPGMSADASLALALDPEAFMAKLEDEKEETEANAERERKASLRGGARKVELTKTPLPPSPPKPKSRIPIATVSTRPRRVSAPTAPTSHQQGRRSITPTSPPRIPVPVKRKPPPPSPGRKNRGKENRLSGVPGHTPGPNPSGAGRRKAVEKPLNHPVGGDVFEFDPAPASAAKKSTGTSKLVRPRPATRTVSPQPPLKEEETQLSFSAPDTVVVPQRLLPHEPEEEVYSPINKGSGRMELLKGAIRSSMTGTPRVSRGTIMKSPSSNASQTFLGLGSRRTSGAPASMTVSGAVPLRSKISVNSEEARKPSVGGLALKNIVPHVPAPQISTEDLDKFANSSLGKIQRANTKEKVAAEVRDDRMTIWLKSLDKVVEDAKTSFAQSGGTAALPKIPAPVRASSMKKSARPGVRTLFENPPPPPPPPPSPLLQSEATASRAPSPEVKEKTKPQLSLHALPPPVILVDEAPPSTPSSTHSLGTPFEGSPSKAMLASPTREAVRMVSPPPPPFKGMEKLEPSAAAGMTSRKHLSTMSQIQDRLNSELFSMQQSPGTSRATERPGSVRGQDESTAPGITISLTDPSGYSSLEDHVPMSPTTTMTLPPSPPQTPPAQLPKPAVEAVYDNFLMSTSTVVRVGKGYQSGSDTLNRVGRGIQSGTTGSVSDAASDRRSNHTSRTRTKPIRKEEIGPPKPRRGSVMNLFTLPRKAPPLPPISGPLPQMPPPPTAIPAPVSSGRKLERRGTVVKVRQAIKSIIHRHRSPEPNDTGMLGMGFVPVTIPRRGGQV